MKYGLAAMGPRYAADRGSRHQYAVAPGATGGYDCTTPGFLILLATILWQRLFTTVYKK